MSQDIDSQLQQASSVAQKFLQLLDNKIGNDKEPQNIKEIAEAAKIMGEALKILIEDIKACKKD